jgi:outer membrane lipoprotein SlyB
MRLSNLGCREKKETAMRRLLVIFGALSLLVSLGCSTPLSTREKGAGIGALGGAAAGGIIGAATGHAGAGAAIGGLLGLGAGALVGDQLQGQEQKQTEQQRQIDQNQDELERQRKDLDKMKRQNEY